MIKFNVSKQNLLNILVFLIFLLGIILRVWCYIINGVFEDDECRLAIALFQSKNFFLPLFQGQTAPPIFSLITYNFARIFNFNEYAFKFIPFCASIASLALFYKLCKEYLNGKTAQLSGFLLFALCIPAIRSGVIFKQYSIDVLIGMLCLYYLPKIKLSELNTQKLLLFISVIILLPFISLPSVFFIGAYFILNLSKKLIFVLIPFGSLMLLYYYFNLSPSSINMETFFPHYWDETFLEPNVLSFIKFITVHLKYLFTAGTYTLFQLILLFIGTIMAFTDKKYRLLLIALFLIFLASLLHIYPFIGRVSLFTVSIFILLIVKPLDLQQKKWYMTMLILFFLSFFQLYSMKTPLKEACVPTYSPDVLVPILKKEYNMNNDIILINNASVNSFFFYAGEFDFKNYDLSEFPSDEKMESFIKTLPKDKSYWIFIVKDYKKSPNRDNILKWVEKQNVLNYHKDKESYLIHFNIL